MHSIHKNKVLITGASGYLGGRIFSTLRKSEVIECILGTRHPDKLQSSAEIRTFDIANPETFSSSLRDVDAVIHLASLNHLDCEKDPVKAQLINVEMVEKLLQAAVEQKVKQFIYLSTFHVYGVNLSGVINEEKTPHPHSQYAKTHLEAENLVLKNKKLNGKVIRLSNAMGAPTYKNSDAWILVANDLCQQAVLQKKIVINSTGFQKRDFISAECVGNAIEVLLKTNESGIFNLGSGSTKSILDLATLIQNSSERIMGIKIPVESKKDATVTPDSFHDFVFDSRRLQSLGFSFKTTVEQEIINTLNSLCSNHEIKK